MIEVFVTSKPVKFVRRNRRTTRKVCADLNHARNYCRKVTEPIISPSSGRNLNAVIRLRVVVDGEVIARWTPEQKWSK